MATYEITAELDLKKIIAESREVAKAVNEFADNLEQIEKKYTEKPEDEKSCNTCKNGDDEFSGECYECVKNIQNHYEPEDEKEEDEEIWCTECPYFKDIVDDDRDWFGALCTKDGHESSPSMYAIQSLHNGCPLKRKEGE